jgi:hypothetical protein
MLVLSGSVRLPQFDDRVRHGNAFAIEDADRQPHRFAERAWSSHLTQRIRREAEMKKWADGL